MSYEVDLVDVHQQPTAVVRAHVGHQGIGDFLGRAFGEVIGAVGHQGLQPTGPPFGRYHPAEDGGWDIEAGFPVSGAPHVEGRVEPASLPGGRAAFTTHVGSYGDLAAAYEAVAAWMTGRGLVPDGEPWECYLDGPDVADPRTEVYFPCAPASAAHPS